MCPADPHASAAPAPPIPVWTGLAGHAARYDGFLLDLWGTVHDGLRPLPGVLDCMAHLRAAGKRLLVLSNAPRRTAAVVARMREIGIPEGAYDAALSSGEAVWQALRDRGDPWHRALGRACFLIGGRGDESAIAGLDLEVVPDPARADFVVCIGVDRPGATVADYEDVLRAARARALPMICANPDLEVLRGTARELCAGALAARYEAIGGDVFYHGKPYPPIYARALDLLAVADRRRILAVGDSLRTDIAGAAAAGLDTLLITGGIHAAALGLAPDEVPDPARLAAFCDPAGVRPTAAMPALRW